MKPATADEKRAVWNVVQRNQMMFGEIAEASGVPFDRVLQVWAEGFKAGRLMIRDDLPGFRYVGVVA
ncbi:hypothetical protein PE067_09255 [Paracoccus sp. DMF-8]|uniref:hypothetical protein n=1 Tax=Paracoccus sp. DMF-8 TaxID=3019445 RepID=UPI0023E834D1|nr:hypothetical protein [Paracoccus sp. DMF-8]MDF3606305.1 hypothetical protein [Paracoccus sp. DMF-8]